MPKQPTLTKAQIDKMLDCQDQLKSSLQGLAVATKKLQQATANVEKESAGGQTSSRGSPWYKKNTNTQAAKDAQKTIDNVVKRFEEDTKGIQTNILFLESQIKYQEKMKDLIQYYRTNIDEDKDKIQKIQSTRAIANRMSTFYEKKDDNALWYRKYLSIGYWIVISLLSIVVLYCLYAGGYLHTAYGHGKEAVHHIKRRIAGQKGGFKYGGDKDKFSKSAKARAILSPTLGLLTLLLITPFILMKIISYIKPVFFPYA